MLHRRLKQDGRGQRVDIGCHPAAAARFVLRIIILVQRTATEVHTGHRVPYKRMQAGVERLGITTLLRKVQVFTGQYRLTGHEVGIHPLPTARKGTTVVNHHQTVIVGIRQDVFVKLHGLLLVAPEKVYLDAPDTGFLHPFHFTVAGYRVVHATARPLRRVVPITVGIVPQIQAYALTCGVTGQFRYPFVSHARIPPGIHEHALVTHVRSEIHVTLLFVIVHAVVAADNPAPRAATVNIPARRLIERFHHIVWYGGLHNRCQRLPHGNRTPRRFAGQGDAGAGCPIAVIFPLLREADGVKPAILSHQAACTIAAVHSRLGNQHPALVSRTEQARKGIAMPPSVLSHLIVHGVTGLITGTGSREASHRSRLRAKERRGALRKHEARSLVLHHAAQGVPLRVHFIFKGHVMVGHMEHDIENMFAVLVKRADGLRGLHVHLAPFDSRQFVMPRHGRNGKRGFLQGHSLREITDVRKQSQRGRCQERGFTIVHTVNRAAAVVGYRHH